MCWKNLSHEISGSFEPVQKNRLWTDTTIRVSKNWGGVAEELGTVEHIDQMIIGFNIPAITILGDW